MNPLDSDLVDQLNLVASIHGEIESTRNLVPHEPAFSVLGGRAQEYADWLAGQLLAGLAVPTSSIVFARKHGHGVRPVPIASVSGRVVYRALVKLILGDRSPVDRSPETYLAFIRAPVEYAHEKAGGDLGWLLGDSSVTHVVKTDLTAFYQYIDHSILQRELLSLTSYFPAISALVQLLSEVEGRAFGLPQLLEPSDDLSDVYADVIERALIREGFPTWRFNDDFLVACESYTEALAAIEALGRHAGDLGLVISEHKTFTPKYATYVFDTLGMTIDEPMPDGDHAIPEDAVADYVAPDPDVQLRDAVATIDNIAEPNGRPPEGKLDLLNLRGDEFRRIRRALRVLTRQADTAGLERALELAIYAPAMTPELVNYLAALDPAEVASTVDAIINQVSLSDWQALWFANLMWRSELLHDDARSEWVRSRCFLTPDPGARAEGALALSIAGLLKFEELELLLRTEPEVFRPWYLAAMAKAPRSAASPSAEQLAAIRHTDREHGLLMP